MKIKKRHLALLAGATAMALTACTPTDDGGDSTADRNHRGGGSRDVSVQLYNQPSTFSPLVAAVGGNELIQSLHWDSLYGVDDEGNYQPRLADSWSVSEDGLEWTFELKQDIAWSDGEPFTAEDVVFTLNLYANPNTGSANAGKFATVEGVEALVDGSADSASGLKAVDDDTFVMTLTEPNTAKMIDFAAPLLHILPEHVYGDMEPDGLAENPAFREPEVGIGPYIFEEWATDDELVFVANPEYRTELGLDRVFAKFMSTDVAQAQLQTGELDYAQVAAADADQVSSMEGVTLLNVDGAGIMALHNAFDSGKLADDRVRQAILYGIDREAIVNDVLGGYGKVVDTLIHGPEWAVPDDLTHYERDVDKAKELLAEAGWDPDTEVRLEIVPGPKDREQVLTIIAAQLQEVGMNAVVTQYDNSAQADAIANRDFDLLISGYGLFNVDPAAMNTLLMCDNGALSGYCDPKLDELLAAGVKVADQEARAEIYAEAQQLFNERIPIFPIYVPDTMAATSDRLEGFKLNPLPTHAFWNAAEWTVE